MFEIIVDGVALPVPAREGYRFTAQKIWSQNAGRSTSTGDFVGDIITKKYTVTLQYDSLTEAAFSVLWTLADSTAAFHSCRFPVIHPRYARQYYMAEPTFTAKVQDPKTGETQYTGVTVEFIQK